MVDITTVGTGLKVLGSLKGLFGKKRGLSPRDQAKAQLMGAFDAADEAGLHRLSVAGSPAGYSPAPVNDAGGLLEAGQALTQHVSRSSRKKQEALLDAQIAEARSRTILNEANAKRTLGGPQPGLGGAPNPARVAFDALANGGARPVSGEPERDQGATQTVTLGNQTARGPNPEAFEVGISELLAGALIYGPQWAKGALDDLIDSLPEPPKRPKPARRSRTTGDIRRQRKPWERK